MNKKIYLSLLLLITVALTSQSIMANDSQKTITVTPNYLDAATNNLPVNKPVVSKQATLKPATKATSPQSNGFVVPPAPPPPPLPSAFAGSTIIGAPAEIDPEQNLREIEAKQNEEKLAEDKARASFVDKLMDINYNVKVPPKQLYQQTDNNHLPPVYFKSYYLSLAFKAAENDDINQLNAALSRYNFLNGQNKNGDTILMYAIQNRSLNVARLLLAKGAYVNAVNQRQRTALAYAATLGDMEAIKLLLTMGADPLLKDDRGMNALNYAQANKHYDAYVLLAKFE